MAFSLEPKDFCGLESDQLDINITNNWSCQYGQYLQQHWIQEVKFPFMMMKGNPLCPTTPDKILNNLYNGMVKQRHQDF